MLFPNKSIMKGIKVESRTENSIVHMRAGQKIASFKVESRTDNSIVHMFYSFSKSSKTPTIGHYFWDLGMDDILSSFLNSSFLSTGLIAVAIL